MCIRDRAVTGIYCYLGISGNDDLPPLQSTDTEGLYTGTITLDQDSEYGVKSVSYTHLQKKFTIAEVMYMVGFSNHSYFSKCFQSEFGKTPRQYLNEEL